MVTHENGIEYQKNIRGLPWVEAKGIKVGVIKEGPSAFRIVVHPWNDGLCRSFWALCETLQRSKTGV